MSYASAVMCYEAIICPRCSSVSVVKNGKTAQRKQRYLFYERECQEKNLLLIWQPECSLTASPAVLDEPDVMGRRRSLSIELCEQRCAPDSAFAAVNVASMATIVLLVTRSLWQFQVVRGGLLLSQGLFFIDRSL